MLDAERERRLAYPRVGRGRGRLGVEQGAAEAFRVRLRDEAAAGRAAREDALALEDVQLFGRAPGTEGAVGGCRRAFATIVYAS